MPGISNLGSAHRLHTVGEEHMEQSDGQELGGVTGRHRLFCRKKPGLQVVQFSAEVEQVWQEE